MNFMQSLCARILLACACSTLAGAAMAGPTYHVSVDTGNYATLGTGGLQMTFLSAGMPDPLVATVSGLSGSFLGQPELSNVDVGEDGTMRFSSASFNEFFQLVTLGGVFAFDVRFDGTFGGDGGTAFNVGLYDADDLTHDLIDVVELSAAYINFSTGEPVQVQTADIGSVTEVPEPSTLLSLVTGIGLLGGTLRRRAR